ncbi:MAG: methyltransferase domain-containing protein [Acidobacteriota bacterium]
MKLPLVSRWLRRRQPPVPDGPRLHTGCGPEDFFPRLLDGWVNLDNRYDHPEHGPVDLVQEWPFADSSVAVVYSEDLIEHLEQRLQFIYFAEAIRVLKPHGVLRVVCPMLNERIIRRVAFPNWPDVGFRSMDYGAEWLAWGHVLIPTYEYLARALELIGFVEITRRNKSDSVIPDFPGDKRPVEMDPSEQLYVEARKPGR